MKHRIPVTDIEGISVRPGGEFLGGHTATVRVA